MTDIVIASAARTPVGSFNGAFASLPAHALGTIAIQAALERAGVKAEEVDEVILGQILTAGAGQNPARQAAVAAGIPVERTAFGINQLCGSGLRAVALAAQQIATGDAAHRGRRRAGEHDPGAALREPARRARRWAAWSWSTPCCATGCGTPSTATTWATRPRTSRRSTSSPARSRTSSPPTASARRARR